MHNYSRHFIKVDKRAAWVGSMFRRTALLLCSFAAVVAFALLLVTSFHVMSLVIGWFV